MVVIRGGSLRDHEALLEQVLDHAEMGLAALSVFADVPGDDETEDECFQRILRLQRLPHGKVQRSSGSRLEAAGFEIRHDPGQDQGPLHYHVVFAEPVAQSQAQAFVAAFDPPTPNPYKGAS